MEKRLECKLGRSLAPSLDLLYSLRQMLFQKFPPKIKMEKSGLAHE